MRFFIKFFRKYKRLVLTNPVENSGDYILIFEPGQLC